MPLSERLQCPYRRAFPCGQLRYTIFDFHKRLRRGAYMRKAFARLPALVHPDCKTQEVEAFLSGINDAGLGLVQREIKPIQHLPYRGQGRIYFARTASPRRAWERCNVAKITDYCVIPHSSDHHSHGMSKVSPSMTTPLSITVMRGSYITRKGVQLSTHEGYRRLADVALLCRT